MSIGATGWRAGWRAVALLCLATSAFPAPASPRLAGGETTVARTRASDFLEPLANLELLRQERHLIGRSLFRNPWVIPPSSTDARDGLGPVFNARSCLACHRGGGRGHPPQDDEPLQSLVVHVGVPDGISSRPEPTYGRQIQTYGVSRGPAQGLAVADAALDGRTATGEARVSVRYRTIEGHYDDGTSYHLRAPRFQLDSLAYGPLSQRARLSGRVAQPLLGVGLLEAIPESRLEALADPEDSDGDGISGRLARLGDGRVGRFGHKASQPDVRAQTAAAFRDDLGITSALFREQPCTAVQAACRAQPDGNGPQQAGVEIADDLLAATTFYVRTLAVTARAPLGGMARRGEALFERIGCATCHVPSHQTGALAGFPELSGQRIHPYTDLLLHDMGPGLDDGLATGAARSTEWRTPPLWGIGLTERVTGRQSYLHDGRARTLAEAVMWHGGEAAAARARFAALDRDERAALIKFLEAL